MKQILLATLTGVLAGLLGAVLAIEFAADSGDQGLDPGLGEKLEALRSRLAIIEGEMETGRRERAEDRARAGRGPAAASAAELAALRADLDRLREQLSDGAAVVPEDAVPSAVAGESPALANLIDRRLRVLEEQKRAEAQERKREQNAKRIDAEVRNRVQGFAKKLQLDQDQTKRFEVEYQEAVDVAMPLYGTLKDETSGNDDRLAAIDRLRSNRRELDENARSIMSAPQYEGFVQMRAKEDEAIGRWLDQTEAGIRGTTPAR